MEHCPKCPKSCSPSYPTLLEALATSWDNAPWDTVPCQGAKLHRLDRPLDRIKASTHNQVNLTNMLDLNTNSCKLDHLYGETSSNKRLDKSLEA